MVILAFFESWFPLIIIFTYQFLTPVFSYAFTMFFAAFIMTSFSIYKGTLTTLRNSNGIKYLLLTSFFITLLFLFVFAGLKYTTASNMAVILFMQLFFSFLYFHILGNETISSKHILGAVLMGSGAIGILFPEDLNFNKGDLLILIAAIIAPIANYYQKRARAYYSADVILSFRNMISFPILFLIAFIIEPIPHLDNIIHALPYLLISGLIIMGLAKIFWVEAIYLISITKATALSALVPIFTIVLAYFILDETPTYLQIISSVPIIIGGYFITRRES